MEEKDLLESYKNKNTFGCITITNEGIKIQNNLLTFYEPNSIKVERIGDKTKVTCSFYCDSFHSIP